MSFSEIFTSISLGLLASTSPCILPLYPGYLAYLSGGQSTVAGRTYGRYFLGFFVLAGVLTMMLALGFIIAALSLSVGRALSVLLPLADFLIIGLGVMLLLNFNPFKQLPQLQVPVLSHPYINAFVYGLLYGPIALPCSGPLVVGIFALSLTATEAINQLAIFLWFLSGSAQRWITRQFALHARLINLIGGLLLVGIGLYDLWSNWDSLRLFWG